MPLNPQQRAFKKAYCSPRSPTFGNAYQSALSVGFAEEYATVITAKGTLWMEEIVRDMELLDKAEEALHEALDYDVKNGEEKIDPAVAGIKSKVGMFVAERLGKERYSLRNEVTGEDGEAITWRVVRGRADEPLSE